MKEHSIHAQHHGHKHDHGVGAFFRYLKLFAQFWRSEVSDAVVASIRPMKGERVVDLGAGMGAASVVAARDGAKVIAVDPTSFMRGVLHLRGFLGGLPVAVMDGAAESLPLEDASVDALWTVNTIHHWTDKAAACREIARVVRPGGRILLVDEDFDDPAHPDHQRHQKSAARHHFDFAGVKADSLARALGEVGFARSEGMKEMMGGRPAKVVRAYR